ncbi:MAG: ABC transporter substrate-binding protein [Candidatus Hadarchaeales archaeon]
MEKGGLNIPVVLVGALALILLSSAVFLLISPAEKKETVGPVVIQDLLGREVVIPENLSRVVAAGPGALRLLCYLDATDLLVGVEEAEKNWGFTGRDYAMAYGQRFENLPVIGPGGPGRPPSPELLLAVQPQLILLSPTYASMYDPDRLQNETGAVVMVTGYGATGVALEALENMISTLGRALRREERAKELVDFIEGLRRDLDLRTAGLENRPSVYVGAISYKGPQPFTTTQSPYPPLQLLNTPSIADNATSGEPPTVDFEFILQKDPNFVFIDQNNLNTVLQDFNKDPAKYRHLSAFREGRVYGLLPYNYYATNFSVALANAYYLGKILYPDRFADVDPVKKADEIFRTFVGKPLYSAYENAYGGFRNLSALCPPS